jgi:hypothetical protein
MKRPRIEDFDPSIVPKLGSSMDELPPITPPGGEPATEIKESLQQREASQPGGVRSLAKRPMRTLTRVAWEIYQDQVVRLRRLSLDEKEQGEKGSMSEMVREALDDYLNKRSG